MRARDAVLPARYSWRAVDILDIYKAAESRFCRSPAKVFGPSQNIAGRISQFWSVGNDVSLIITKGVTDTGTRTNTSLYGLLGAANTKVADDALLVSPITTL